MNRRDLLKGLAAAGVVLPIIGSASSEKLGKGEGIIRDDGAAEEIWHTWMEGKQLHINLDNVLGYHSTRDVTGFLSNKSYIPNAYVSHELNVEMYFERETHGEFVEALHGMRDVICYSKRMGRKLHCTSRSVQLVVQSAANDVVLELGLHVDREEAL